MRCREPSNVMVVGVDPWLLIAWRKNALAAPTSHLARSRKSTVPPVLSTARYKYTHFTRILT
jgi:putative transposase